MLSSDDDLTLEQQLEIVKDALVTAKMAMQHSLGQGRADASRLYSKACKLAIGLL